MTVVRIDPRFRGPPDSANGGYFAGLLARQLGGSDVVVTLKRPAPLGRDLFIESGADSAALLDGDSVLALAERAAVAVECPPPPSLESARAASARFTGLESHIYPGCFVCGPARERGDGWRIFPGPVGPELVAAVFVPGHEFADANGMLRPEFIWAALDCPGYFAVEQRAGLALLGRIGVHLSAPAPCEEELVVCGWGIGSDGRKHRAGTALFDRIGALLAASTQTWITLEG